MPQSPSAQAADVSHPAFELFRGDSPLMVSMPHVGTGLPADLAARLNPAALSLADTDWHLPRVYDFVREMGATLLVATQSRYVIDLNRPPDGASLYPGMTTTSLVPTETFRGELLYPDGAPDEAEIAQRREQWWRPYHAALAGELARLRALHPRVVLWDAHSIASVLPRFFEGRLPDLNFGTADGQACDPALSLIHI
jgi:N-formylglutamate deformylase